MKALLILALFASGCCSWSKRDTGLELASLGAMVIDLHQTIQIVQECAEVNPLIGACGENISPNKYFLGAMITHVVVAAVLPPKWRTRFQLTTIGAETVQVVINYSEGWGTEPLYSDTSRVFTTLSKPGLHL